MKQPVYHGILVNKGFVDPAYPEKFRVFNRIDSGDWRLYGVEIEKDTLNVLEIQENMVSHPPYYCHFYDDEELIAIFKDRYFTATSHASTWNEIITHGKELGIKPEQLDFWPNRFQDEPHYFRK